LDNASKEKNGEQKIKKKINIPPEMKQPGAVYRVGNSYYDEDGEFLYKAI